MGVVEGIPFPKTARSALMLRRTPEEVARMSRSNREERVRHLIGYAHWVVQLAKERHFERRSLAATCILYSGGNDSTVLAHLFQGDADYAVHANTTIGVEATREFVRNTCRGWGLELIERTPSTTYRDLVLEQGFPGPGQHFKMYQRLKERCLEQVRNELIENPYRQRVLFLGGRRRSESRRRADIPATDRRKSMVFASPLVLWTKPDLNTYRLMAGDVPVNEVSDLIHMSGECLCGAFAEKGELEEVGSWFPEVREQIESLERELEGRTDLPEARRKWGWGAYRRDLETLKARGHYRSGSLCGACDDRATGGPTIATCTPVSDPVLTVDSRGDEGENVNDTTPERGPWFGAMYDGRCSVSDCQIYEGDRIRADGEGGYECEDCGEDEDPLPVVGLAEDPSQQVPTPDEFMSPAPVSTAVVLPTPDEFMSPAAVEDAPDAVNVSGQPRARYEWYGSQNRGYLVTLPDTGDFRRYKNGKPKGLTRATTFNKAASDSKAINDWGKRNIVIGASRRRDVLLRAHGLTHENDRAALTAIVAELEEAAGAKVGSDLGMYLHEFTEQMDAGLKTWQEAPYEFHLSLSRYEQTLRDAGLEPVPGLIERTTMITEFGGVVGTFDRIFYYRPSGTYIVGDLKTGKTMEYAMNETETQMWIYAHGVNQNGVYDWNTDGWGPVGAPMTPGPHPDGHPIKVREDVGVIIHMPVQGSQAGTVTLVHADLEAGARHAELCHRNRTAPKSKVRAFQPPLGPIDFSQPLPEEPKPRNWHAEFKAVTSRGQANALYKELLAHGANEEYLALARLFGKEALARVDTSS